MGKMRDNDNEIWKTLLSHIGNSVSHLLSKTAAVSSY